MRKSTDYGFGGASFLVIGMLMIFSIIRATFTGTIDLVFAFVYILFGAAIMSVGIYWLWKAQRFYNAERMLGARPPSQILGPP